jgi:hypothetical protein
MEPFDFRFQLRDVLLRAHQLPVKTDASIDVVG